MMPGFEKKIFGMTMGDTKAFTVLPEEAYGSRQPRGIDARPLTLFLSPVGRGVGEGKSMTRRKQRYANKGGLV
jgi:FKBP-type peptidyl-prolyl cis-trans isomerase 2